MDFKDQITALTGLTISSSDTNPTEAQVSQYLIDGAKDVINKIFKIAPDEMFKFSSSSTDTDGSGITVKGKVLSVVRERGATIRPCTPINSAARYLATELGSLMYRSSYNPAWYELAGKIYTIPTPTGGDDALVTHIAYPTFQHNDVSINDFPDEYEYLVAIYAAMQSIFNKMSSITVPVDSPVTNNIDTSIIDNYISDEEEELASITINKLSAFVNAHQSEVLGNKTEYEWLQYRHSFFSQVYNAAFGAMMPQQQPQQQQQARA